MKKSFLYKAMAMIVAMTASISFVSCDDDDDKDEPVNPNELKGVAVDYDLEITDDMLAFYDITVVYGIDDKPGQAEVVTLKDFEYANTYSTVPSKVSFKAVAKPKTNLPTIDPDKVYTFKVKYDIEVKGVLSGNRTTMLNGKELTHPNITTKGDKVQQLLDRGEIVIVDYNFDIPKK